MSLDGAYDDQNIFAKILRGEAPCHKVMEDDVAIAFMDVFPQAIGHTLVVPKRAARNLLDLPEDALGPFMTRVQRVALAVRRALAPDGVTVMQFNGEAGGQTVFHLHFHVIPRMVGVGLAGHGVAGRGDDADLAALADKIGAAYA